MERMTAVKPHTIEDFVRFAWCMGNNDKTINYVCRQGIMVDSDDEDIKWVEPAKIPVNSIKEIKRGTCLDPVRRIAYTNDDKVEVVLKDSEIPVVIWLSSIIVMWAE